MSVLKNLNIEITWALAYVGLIKNWISPKQVLNELSNKELNLLNEETMAAIYVAAEESKESFSKFIKHQFQISDTMVRDAIWIGSIAYLDDVSNSEKSIFEKLMDVANIWAMVDYPKEWKHFIYYMPVEGNEETGEEKVYQRFFRFLMVAKAKLNEKRGQKN